ncbi:uncharacterized protein LOC101240185 isoform X1 [Hydra vulgaris]|uniref:uncharacterized protein LOC101240185 isoform X1 n=1 Tax=Hydra vulgaris TaxID=6087 RepID=UPI001F5FDBE8|nr:uncharacterized protein LOC101240185 [Hydra vulgaris]
MEGCPKQLMISFDLKEPVSTEDVFEKPLKKYIQDFYHEDPNSYQNEINQITQLRKSISNIPHDKQGCNILHKYYVQLQYLLARFPMREGGVACTTFIWYDVYNFEPVSYKDIKFEQACVLYSLAGLNSHIGSNENRLSDESLRTACTHFQTAAGAYQFLKENFSLGEFTDMSEDILTMKYNVMLGQALECILEKSIRDNRNAILIARVCIQVVEYFDDAASLLDKPGTSEIASSTRKSWIKHLKIKSFSYHALAYTYMSNDASEKEMYGAKVCYLQAALKKITEATKLLKKQPIQVVESVQFMADVVNQKYDAAKKDNDFVYHMLVPELSSMEEIKGVNLIKPIPFQYNDAAIAGVDIFHKLVPMKAHELSSIYSEVKDNHLRSITNLIDVKNTELSQYMSAMNIEELLNPKGDCLPDELVLKNQFLRDNPDIICKVEKDTEELTVLTSSVEFMLNDIKKMLESIVDSKSENTEILSLKDECEKWTSAHVQARKTNEELSKLLEESKDKVIFLSGDPKVILQSMPSQDIIEAPSDEPFVQRIREILGKIEKMKDQRAYLLSKLREQLHKDDITSQLVIRGDEDKKAFFNEQLQKHNETTDYIKQNIAAQENILQALTEANAKYATVREKVAIIKSKFHMQAKTYIATIVLFLELKERIRAGLTFYYQLKTNVESLLQKVESIFNKNKQLKKTEPPTRPTASKPILLTNKINPNQEFLSPHSNNSYIQNISTQSFLPSNIPQHDLNVRSKEQDFTNEKLSNYGANVPQIVKSSYMSQVNNVQFDARFPLNTDNNRPMLRGVSRMPVNINCSSSLGQQQHVWPQSPQHSQLKSFDPTNHQDILASSRNSNQQIPYNNTNLQTMHTLPHQTSLIPNLRGTSCTRVMSPTVLHESAPHIRSNFMIQDPQLLNPLNVLKMNSDLPATNQFTGSFQVPSNLTPRQISDQSQIRMHFQSYLSTGQQPYSSVTQVNFSPPLQSLQRFSLHDSSMSGYQQNKFPQSDLRQQLGSQQSLIQPQNNNQYLSQQASIQRHPQPQAINQTNLQEDRNQNYIAKQQLHQQQFRQQQQQHIPLQATLIRPQSGSQLNQFTYHPESTQSQFNMQATQIPNQIRSQQHQVHSQQLQHGSRQHQQNYFQTEFPRSQFKDQFILHRSQTPNQLNFQSNEIQSVNNFQHSSQVYSNKVIPQPYSQLQQPMNQVVLSSSGISNQNLNVGNFVTPSHLQNLGLTGDDLNVNLPPPLMPEIARECAVPSLLQQNRKIELSESFNRAGTDINNFNKSAVIPRQNDDFQNTQKPVNFYQSSQHPLLQTGHKQNVNSDFDRHVHPDFETNSNFIKDKYSNIELPQNTVLLQDYALQPDHSRQQDYLLQQNHTRQQEQQKPYSSQTIPQHFHQQLIPNKPLLIENQVIVSSFQPINSSATTTATIQSSLSLGNGVYYSSSTQPNNLTVFYPGNVIPSQPGGVLYTAKPTMSLLSDPVVANILGKNVSTTDISQLGFQQFQLQQIVLQQQQLITMVQSQQNILHNEEKIKIETLQGQIVEQQKLIESFLKQKKLAEDMDLNVKSKHPETEKIILEQQIFIMKMLEEINERNKVQNNMLEKDSHDDEEAFDILKNKKAYNIRTENQSKMLSDMPQTDEVKKEDDISDLCINSNVEMIKRSIYNNECLESNTSDYPSCSQKQTDFIVDKENITAQSIDPANSLVLNISKPFYEPKTDVNINCEDLVAIDTTVSPDSISKTSKNQNMETDKSVSDPFVNNDKLLIKSSKQDVSQQKIIAYCDHSPVRSDKLILTYTPSLSPPSYSATSETENNDNTSMNNSADDASVASDKHVSQNKICEVQEVKADHIHSPLIQTDLMKDSNFDNLPIIQADNIDADHEDVHEEGKNIKEDISNLTAYRQSLERQIGHVSFCGTEPNESARQAYIDDLDNSVSSLQAKCRTLCELLPHDKNIDGFTSIWRDLEKVEELDISNYTTEAGEINVTKNRYRDILPWDHSRVHLMSVPDDYINASFVENLTPFSPRYVATQAPIPQTFEDFWVMVWEQNASVIVMLTNEVEGQKLKCHPYWNRNIDEPVEYGIIAVILLSENINPSWKIRTFMIFNKKEDSTRVVKHLQFTSWPDYGTPETPNDLLIFMDEVYQFHMSYDPSTLYPLILHCSAGVGRTGTFCCLYSAIHEIRGQNGLIEIPGVIRKLRQCRPHMVQRKEQMIFCYQAILQFAQQFLATERTLLESSEESSIENAVRTLNVCTLESISKCASPEAVFITDRQASILHPSCTHLSQDTVVDCDKVNASINNKENVSTNNKVNRSINDTDNYDPSLKLQIGHTYNTQIQHSDIETEKESQKDLLEGVSNTGHLKKDDLANDIISNAPKFKINSEIFSPKNSLSDSDKSSLEENQIEIENDISLNNFIDKSDEK